ncbi:MAG: hypothetical protein L0H15_11355 [Nitrosospira sp.]|nr:hypothetical protein [Nitrosospira sp.]MDN5882147.1 hypothetical protein [Nitrosospira sp.]MDN5935247.1 hypothetical protein [Nitrosospira sp.]
MRNKTGGEGAQKTTVSTATLETEVRNAIAQGGDVKRAVQHMTVKALSSQHHDLESLRRIMTAVMQGVREGAQQNLQHPNAQAHTALTPIRDAVAGLDAALAQFAEASKLALEEATGRAQKFSNEELTRVRADLESVEPVFLDVVQASAASAQKAVSEILHDLVAHAKRNGTAVGSQLKDTLAALNHQMTSVGHTRFEAGMQLTHAITDLMRQVAAGVLTGIAERVKPHDNTKGG